MGISRIVLTSFSFLFFFSQFPSFGQIVFKQLPGYQINLSDSVFFDLTSTRKIIPLNGSWKVFPVGDEDAPGSEVTVPSIFSGEGELIFEKSFNFSRTELTRNRVRLFFLGLNYTADISVNDVIIFRHSGGDFPFQLELPKDILSFDKPNILRVKLNYTVDSENTIPVKQRFLFPQSFGGIFRDVYLQLIPNTSISDINVSTGYTPKGNTASVNLNIRIDHKDFNSKDTILLKFRAALFSPDGSDQQVIDESPFLLHPNSEKLINKTFAIKTPLLWSPQSPYLYKLHFQLLRDDLLIDESFYETGIYSLSVSPDSLDLNGSSFIINGVTYIPSNKEFGSMMSYADMERDIRIIKNAGFNSVRFSHSSPHPFYLKLCSFYGLLSFIEIPANAIPAGLINDINFMERSRNYLTNFLKSYRKYTSLAAVGVGSSIPGDSGVHLDFLPELTSIVKKNSSALTYASFSGIKINQVEGLDMYGIEIFNKPVQNISEYITGLQEQFGEKKVFISSATYVVNTGSSDGYLNDHSYEAQAKFFEELLTFSDENVSAGYFLNTMFDYRGDFSSLAGGYNENNIYHIGIADEDRSTERIAYNVINAKLFNLEKVTIPIGSKKDDAPMLFIIFGLVIALMIGALVNSGRKFREDASRALTRPYNFYADVRDQRMMSGIQTTLLALVISAVSALLISNLLYYLKDKLVFEKILLSFGSPGLMKVISYLSWSPLMSVIWLFAASIAFLLVLTIIVKIASLFVRNRVYLSSVYYIVTWSFLPMVLLIPVGIVLFRMLQAESINIYIYAGLLIFTIWIFYRLMKGIYVIFDVNAGSVYFYSLLFIFLIIGSVFLYYEFTNSLFDYLRLSIHQYNTGI
jgi:beta-galactosidase